ncbi:nucleotidyltransferase family protein [Nannocystaceae bacterium ST9]
MNLVDELHAIAAALRGAGVEYAICGGLAVTIHGATRTTKDIDLLVEPRDVARVLELLRPLGYVFAALPMTFDAGTPSERHVQRVSKLEGDQHVCVDLLLADAAFAGLLADKVEVALPEGPLVVVSLLGLTTMKRLAGRPQDIADLQRLEVPDAD